MISVDRIKGMTEAELDALLEIIDAREPLWSPSEGPQKMAYESKADIIGYGGAAGGGKTDLGLGKALTHHPTTVIYRRTFEELKGINERIAKIVGDWDGHSGLLKAWRLPKLGAHIDYGSLQHCGSPESGPRDEAGHQGRPHSLIIFDEAVNFPEYTVRFLMGWNRHEDPSVHCQTLLTMNPPMNQEGLWVIGFFAPWLDKNHPNPATSGELRWFVYDPTANEGNGSDVEVPGPEPFTLSNGEVVKPKSRTFIFSSVSDNPYYKGSGYESTLQALPEPLRSRLLKGQFLVDLKDHALQVIPSAWIKAAQARWTEKPRLPRMDSLGVDVARGGRDKTVIVPRYEGWYFGAPVKHAGADTPNGRTTAAFVIAELRNQAPIHIDVIGVGSSPYDKLQELGFQVIGVNGSEKAPSPAKNGILTFHNHRTWMWWRLRELLDPEANTGIALPPGDEVLTDLSAPRWGMTGRAIQMESREDIVTRIGRSPDVGTAICLAAIDTPRDLFIRGNIDPSAERRNFDPINAEYGGRGMDNSRRDYDPLED